MTTYTIYGLTGDGYVYSQAGNYATARSTAYAASTGSISFIGQYSNSTGSTQKCYEAFFGFDCSVINAGETVTSAILNLCLGYNKTGTDFILNARTKSWLDTLTTGDWVAGASLSALTLLGSFDTTGLPALENYFQFSDIAMTALVDAKSATTDFLVSGSRHEAGTEMGHPSDEHIYCYSANQAGTSKDPYLDVIAAGAGPPLSVFYHHYKTMAGA